MNYIKGAKFFSVLILLIMVCAMPDSCISRANSSSSRGNEDLSTWVGEYTFGEDYFEPDSAPLIMDYKVTIYSQKDDYFANIEIMGQTTAVSVKAKLYGDEEWISLIFLEYLPNHVIGLSSKDNSVLLSFRKEESDIYTYWGEIEPMLYENQDSGKIYFAMEKEEN